jgi:hypothetical protein
MVDRLALAAIGFALPSLVNQLTITVASSHPMFEVFDIVLCLEKQ